MLIPPSEDIARFEIDDRLSWVLVVEKEVRRLGKSAFCLRTTVHVFRPFSRRCAMWTSVIITLYLVQGS